MTFSIPEAWYWFIDALNRNADTLHSLTEFVKLAGSVASFYAVYRLWRLEKRYLFKATIPTITRNIDKALKQLNQGIVDTDAFGALVSEALHCLHADAKRLRRKVDGDSKVAIDELLASIRKTGLGRRFWERSRTPSIEKPILLDIYGKGRGLLRSLKNDMGDMKWSTK